MCVCGRVKGWQIGICDRGEHPVGWAATRVSCSSPLYSGERNKCVCSGSLIHFVSDAASNYIQQVDWFAEKTKKKKKMKKQTCAGHQISQHNQKLRDWGEWLLEAHWPLGVCIKCMVVCTLKQSQHKGLHIHPCNLLLSPSLSPFNNYWYIWLFIRLFVCRFAIRQGGQI